MKKLKLLCIGAALATIGVGALLYGLAVFFCAPMYEARTVVSFERPEKLDLLSRQMSIFSSTNVLYPVCDALNLQHKFGEQFGGPDFVLRLSECCQILTGRMLVTLRSAQEIEISLRSSRPTEAVEEVNSVASFSAEWFNRNHRDQNSGQLVRARETRQAKHLITGPLFYLRLNWGIGLAGLISGAVLILSARKMPGPLFTPQSQVGTLISRY